MYQLQPIIRQFKNEYNYLKFIGLLVLISSCKDSEETKDQNHLLKASDLPEYESKIDHLSLVNNLDDDSYKRGEEIYLNRCFNCHGNPTDEGSLPNARKFWQEEMVSGKDPYAMYQTIGQGFGSMPPQVQLVPQQKYDVIHYIREAYFKEQNPDQYVEISEKTLKDLPKGTSTGPEAKKYQPWAEMNYGNHLIYTYELVDLNAPEREISKGRAPLKDENLIDANFAYKGIAMRLDQGSGGIAAGNSWLIFDQDLMRVAGAWTGKGFIDWEGILLNDRHNISPRTVGDLHFYNPVEPGWANPETGSFKDPRFTARDGRKFGPLPKKWTFLKGIYQNDNKITLSYTVGKAQILEQFGVTKHDDKPVFIRTINVTSAKNDLKMRIAPVQNGVKLLGQGAKISQENGFHLLNIPKNKQFQISLFISGTPDQLKKLPEIPHAPSLLADLLIPKNKQQIPEIQTTIQNKKNDGPFELDVLTPPYDNPFKSRMRLTGIDFFNEDRAAICTIDGEVWLVDGISKEEGTLTWKRIATGLYQPLGIKVIDQKIYATCRNQIVVLHDLNDDELIDFYENFNSDHQVTDHFHEFAMGLQTDKEGNLYYAKSGRHAREALVPQHGTLLKVSKDGTNTEIMATGFRAANGVCINPDGSFVVTDQEGHWNPMNRINWVDKKGFYGNMFGYNPPKDSTDQGMIQPLCWIDKAMDRSPSELLWVDSDKWGPFKNSLLNLSYGYGTTYIVPHEKLEGQMQGGIFKLPVPVFPTGVMRGRFNPADGHLYTCGMSAWATQQTQRPGGFYRVRYTGKPTIVPLKTEAKKDGMIIHFSDELDPESVRDIKNYVISTWELKRSRSYGSEHYNEKTLALNKAEILEDGKTIKLSISDMNPVWQLEIKFELKLKNGATEKGVIQNTIHNLSS